METPIKQAGRTVDVTGLPDEAVRAVESLVADLRAQANCPCPAYGSYEAWSRAFREWVDSHPKRDTFADDSRESIYAGQGE